MIRFAGILWVLLTIAGLSTIVVHHLRYFRRTRSLTFGAFLETAGWLVVTLVAITAIGGGMADPGTRVAELAAAVVGVLLIGIGGSRK